MADKTVRCTPEFRRQMVALARSGRNAAPLSKEFARHRERCHEALFGFVKVNQATHSVGMMCRLLDVSRSGFYAWVDRPLCPRRRRDLKLTGKIGAIHWRSREAYGAPNIHAELADDHGIRVGRKRVARPMRQNGTPRSPWRLRESRNWKVSSPKLG